MCAKTYLHTLMIPNCGQGRSFLSCIIVDLTQLAAAPRINVLLIHYLIITVTDRINLFGPSEGLKLLIK